MPAALAGPLLLIAAAAVLWVAAADIPVVPVPGQLGPDFWPRLGVSGLALASAVKVVQVLRAAAHGRRGEADVARAPLHLGRLAGAAGCLVLYALLVPLVGFPLATLAFLVAFMQVGGYGRPVAATAWSLALTVGLLYLFVKVVYLPLPRGQGPFHDATLALYRVLGLL